MGGERNSGTYDLRIRSNSIRIKVSKLQVHCTIQWVMSCIDVPTNNIGRMVSWPPFATSSC